MTVLTADALRICRPVTPFAEKTRIAGVSGGLSSCGYDIHLGQDVMMWPGRFKLAITVERFMMPCDLVGIVHDKSTWARCGLALQNTVIEPGWHGFLTLEMTMHRLKVLRLRKGTPIAQVIFHRLDEPVGGYNGKYQGAGRSAQDAIFERHT